jgi:hypothetical protein
MNHLRIYTGKDNDYSDIIFWIVISSNVYMKLKISITIFHRNISFIWFRPSELK